MADTPDGASPDPPLSEALNPSIGAMSAFGRADPTLGNYAYYIRIYTGDKDGDQNIDEFLNSISEVSTLAGWSPKVTKMVLRSKLKGIAHEYFASNATCRISEDLTLISQALRNRFGGRSSGKDSLGQLLRIKQHHGEHIYEYGSRIDRLRARIEDGPERDCINDTLVHRIFIDGLQESVRMHLVARCPDGYQNALAKAVEIQDELFLMSGSKQTKVFTATTVPHTTTPIPDACTSSKDREIAELKRQL